MTGTKSRIGIIGGTGALGSGLAKRLAEAGYPIRIGSRDPAKAAEAASVIGHGAQGMGNVEAAAAAEIVIVTVPFSNQAASLSEIKPHLTGKLVIDTTVPLVPPRVARVQLPAEGSAAMAAHKILGEGARLVSAFHNVAAHKLHKLEPIHCDVLVFGDAPADRDIVIALASAVGLRGLHAGPLANSAAAEALTSILIGINRSYKVDGAGIQITGIETGHGS